MSYSIFVGKAIKYLSLLLIGQLLRPVYTTQIFRLNIRIKLILYNVVKPNTI